MCNHGESEYRYWDKIEDQAKYWYRLQTWEK